jgi:amidohydrolase
MTILTGLGIALSKDPPESGRVLLLYQPAEETGEGAARVLDDPQFASFSPDKVYALHNLPGFPSGSIVTKPGTFASASKGKEVFLYGRTSHAGEPQNGISPALAMSDIVKQFFFLSQRESFEDFVLVTVIHAKLGSISFGTSPGEAEVRATLRTFREDDMSFLTEKAEAIATKEARENDLAVAFDEKEVFPACVNDEEANGTVEKAANDAGLQQQRIREPFKWSEDLGHFLARWPGALFGLGSGEDQPDLHNPDFDFPDEVIEQGVRIFEEVARKETTRS